MRVNMNKTKVMIIGERQKVMQKAVRWPCGVCDRGVGNNSIQCTTCHKWVHRKSSGIKGAGLDLGEGPGPRPPTKLLIFYFLLMNQLMTSL